MNWMTGTTGPRGWCVLGAAIGAVIASGCATPDQSRDGPERDGEQSYALGAWTAAAPMLEGRAGHGMVTLPDGRVLVEGGLTPSLSSTTSAEIYDPALNVWSMAAEMTVDRYASSAILLPNGRALVVGGVSFMNVPAVAEIFDPATGGWAPAGDGAPELGFMARAALPTGEILFAGGYDLKGFYSTVAIYDPAAGTWKTAAPMSTPRVYAGAFALPDGKVLVAGGASGSAANATAEATTEIYDPATDTWTAGPSMASARWAFATAVLPSGKLLVAGGLGKAQPAAPITGVEVFDPTAGTWSDAAPLGTARHAPTSAILPDGRVLVAGGGVQSMDGTLSPTAAAEVYTEETNTWETTGSLGTARYLAATVSLGVGALITGGVNDAQWKSIAGAEIYDPSAVATGGTGGTAGTGGVNQGGTGGTATGGAGGGGIGTGGTGMGGSGGIGMGGSGGTGGAGGVEEKPKGGCNCGVDGSGDGLSGGALGLALAGLALARRRRRLVSWSPGCDTPP